MNIKLAITDTDFNDEFKKACEDPQKLIILDFFASWCKDCTELDSNLLDLTRIYPSVCFIKVDVDTCAVSSHKHYFC